MQKSESDSSVGISVVVCTHNGIARMEATLKAITEQQTTCPWELIIVDNGSTDNTGAWCNEFLSVQAAHISWRIVNEQKLGLNHARLRGIRETIYCWALFADDDNSLDKNYVQTGFEILYKNPQVGAIGGCGKPLFEQNPPSWFAKYSHSFAVGPQSSVDGKLKENPAELYGAGTFFRKEALLRFFDNGFKAIMTDRLGNSLASGGDVEWCYLIQLAGFEVWYDSRLQFMHLMPAGRMQWPYYLRLKAGIAGGAARLLPYNCLLRQPDMSSARYLQTWFFKTLLYSMAYLKHLSMHLFRSHSPERQLALEILKAKANAFWRDGFVAYRHFKQLKALR